MIDLHLHLDGSLSPEVVKELARLQGISLPRDLDAALTVPANCQSLNDYLRCFELPVALLQSGEALTLAVRELSARLAAQGLLYAELRFAPSQHGRRGLTQAEAVEAAIAGLPKRTEESRPFSAQLILCCMRGGDPAANRETVETVARYLGQGVCALDLAGAEALYPTGDSRELFQLARALGIPFTIHAGEAAGPESIRQALELGAQRIGHGVRAGEDPQLVGLLAQRGIPLELCPTSNLQTRAVPSLERFPLREFLKKGVAATVNTDNMTVSHTTLKREFQLLSLQGLTQQERRTLLRNSVQGAFLPPKEKEVLSRELERRLKA